MRRSFWKLHCDSRSASSFLHPSRHSFWTHSGAVIFGFFGWGFTHRLMADLAALRSFAWWRELLEMEKVFLILKETNQTKFQRIKNETLECTPYGWLHQE